MKKYFNQSVSFALQKFSENREEIIKIVAISAFIIFIPVIVYHYSETLGISNLFLRFRIAQFVAPLSLLAILAVNVGFINISLKLKRGKEIIIEDLFEKKDRYSASALGLMLWVSLSIIPIALSLLVSVVLFIIFDVIAVFIATFFLGALISFWNSIKFIYSHFFIFDKNSFYLGAFEKSYRRTKDRNKLLFLINISLIPILSAAILFTPPALIISSNFFLGASFLFISGFIFLIIWLLFLMAQAYFYDEYIKDKEEIK